MEHFPFGYSNSLMILIRFLSALFLYFYLMFGFINLFSELLIKSGVLSKKRVELVHDGTLYFLLVYWILWGSTNTKFLRYIKTKCFRYLETDTWGVGILAGSEFLVVSKQDLVQFLLDLQLDILKVPVLIMGAHSVSYRRLHPELSWLVVWFATARPWRARRLRRSLRLHFCDVRWLLVLVSHTQNIIYAFYHVFDRFGQWLHFSWVIKFL